jgi:hypothetical protein
MIASKYNNKEACLWLINNKANAECKNILGEDAVKLAHDSSIDIINMLVTYKNQSESTNYQMGNMSNRNNLSKQNTLKGMGNKNK